MSANRLWFSSLFIADLVCLNFAGLNGVKLKLALHSKLERLITHPLLFLVREKSFKLENSLLSTKSDGLGDGRMWVK